MGTVVRADGMRVWVWSNDHDPPHAHVEGADWEITIYIGDEAMLADIKGGSPSLKTIRAAVALVGEHLEAVNAEWRRCHG